MTLPLESNDLRPLQASVESVLYQSSDGRFSVVKALPETGQEAFVAVGNLGGVAPGEVLRLEGQWSDHPTYGRRFQVHHCALVMPATAHGVARYLGSGLIPGVGPALAQRLVDRFGDRTLEVIASQSVRLQEVSGIGRSRAQAIAEAVRKRAGEAEAASYLASLDIGPATARRILDKYGTETSRVISRDPYMVAEEVSGIGFRTADRIGQSAGIELDDPRRAAGAILHLLGKAADEGHVYLPRSALLDASAQWQVPEDAFSRAVDALEARQMIVVEGEAIYAPPLFRAEESVAKKLAQLAGPREIPSGANAALRNAPLEQLADEQAQAVQASVGQGLVVLTGGPGTGKTTTVRTVVEVQRRLGRRVLLCAPTGRAAKRLSEATGMEAKTIHRLLEWNPMTGSFGRNRRAPLDAELILVDEASMLDVRLAASLLSAIPPSSALYLVGDADQLPPVSPGAVLRELIASGAAHTIRLQRIFRQAEKSAIVRAAHAILHGRSPEPSPPGAYGDGDFYVVRASSPDVLIERMGDVLRRMHQVYGLDLKKDVQVLTPMRRGPIGTERLNEVLQHELNPPASARPVPQSSPQPQTSPGRFRPGDKVMQLRNDYEREAFNGDLGEVTRVVAGTTFVDFDGREVQYDTRAAESLALAYASTVHKVQGSEFPGAIVIVHGAHSVLLSRALLYTAVTRAKKLVVLLGEPRAIARAVANATTQTTYTQLAARIRDARSNPE